MIRILSAAALSGLLAMSACTADTSSESDNGSGGNTSGGNTSGGNTSGGNTSGGNTSGGACTPKCDGRQCGDDGCGGQCGTCAGKQSCNEAGVCEAAVPPGVTCPPTGAVGKTAGRIAQAGTIPLAKGGTYDIRANCAKPIYILGVTETCGICMQELGQWSRPGAFLDQLKADGADVVLISTDDPQGANGSAQTAMALSRRFSFNDRYTLAFEPLGRNSFNGFIGSRTGMAGARIALILKPGNVIGAVGQVDSTAQIRAALGL
jgi:hypothetical protein